MWLKKYKIDYSLLDKSILFTSFVNASYGTLFHLLLHIRIQRKSKIASVKRRREIEVIISLAEI